MTEASDDNTPARLPYDPAPSFTPQPPVSELLLLDAVELARRLRCGALSARSLAEDCLAQLDRFDPLINAVPTRVAVAEVLAQADAADRRRMAGEALPPLHGLPLVVKDLTPTRGLRTTRGSPLFADWVPDADALHVARLRQAGAILVGKSNTPEFGAGSHTFNPVFGVTRNPHAPGRSAGGSSGGAAAALAAGMVPLADGSDMGGSLRNPAAFCNVVGLRPSIGRVPEWPALMQWQSRLGVQGPMGRSAADVALLLTVIGQPDRRDPLSLRHPAIAMDASLHFDPQGVRLGWTPDLGVLPVEREIVDVCTAALADFRRLGCLVEADRPEVDEAMDVFRTLRAHAFAAAFGEFVRTRPEAVKPTIVGNCERGFALDGEALAAADQARTRVYQRFLAFFDRCDFLLLPTTQVLPFPVDREWVEEIDGVRMVDYIDWMSSCCIISVTGLPAASIPVGVGVSGLPVGLQIVGPPGGDMDVLRLAHAFQLVTDHHRRRPPILSAVAS